MKGCHRRESVDFLSKTKTRTNGWKLNIKKPKFEIRMNFPTVQAVKQWNSPLPEIVVVPSLEISKKRLGKVCMRITLFLQKVGTYREYRGIEGAARGKETNYFHGQGCLQPKLTTYPWKEAPQLRFAWKLSSRNTIKLIGFKVQHS